MNNADHMNKKKLVIYEVRKIGEEKTFTAHSFMDKTDHAEDNIRAYFKSLNEHAKREKIDEQIELVRITGEYKITKIQ